MIGAMPGPAADAREAPQEREAPDPGAIVRLVDVYKSFGEVRVLRGLNLSVGEGQTLVVLGPSGAGKSVILKHIAGLLRPDSGEVWFRGDRVDTRDEGELVPIRREIGYLFPQSALFDSMTVLENLEFPLLEHTNQNARRRRLRALDALATVDLHDIEHKRPAELSGGQQKRVALARAIILSPCVILYDEPTTGLDPVRADGINDLILKLQGSTGVTSIVVTHDLACMRKVADRVVMLHEGSIRFEGTPDEMAQSEDSMVRRFIEPASEQPDRAASARGAKEGATA